MRLRGEIDVGWGDEADINRVQLIADLIEEGSKDPVIRELAINITRSCAPRDWKCEVSSIFYWVKKNIRYIKDNYFMDTYHAPRRILQLKAGDCDDYTILLGAMLSSIGYPIMIRIIKTKGKKAFHHIYPLVGVPPDEPARWLALDGIVAHSYPGWEVNYAEKKDFKIILEE